MEWQSAKLLECNGHARTMGTLQIVISFDDAVWHNFDKEAPTILGLIDIYRQHPSSSGNNA
jgi:hypothetical protein